MSAYYNEIDPQKAGACLREFIKANLIAPGEVDERSIKDVAPADLRGFTQCHFFAGFGVWSYALRLAGWPDDRPVWTGSCPCPSFSAAGKGKGFDDPRHLWPYWSPLIRECRPATVFGEQVDDAIGHGWLDLVYVDLEKAAYAVGAAVLGACSVGAPHIRQRLYFCAHVRLPSNGLLQRSGEQRLLAEDGGTGECLQPNQSGLFTRRETSEAVGYGSSLDAASSTGDGEPAEYSRSSSPRAASSSEQTDALRSGESCDGSDAESGEQWRIWERETGNGQQERQTGGHGAMLFGIQPLSPRLEGHFGDVRDWRGPGWLDPLTARSVAAAGATRGFWADCDWWHARDEKYRPIEPGLFPLVDGASNRVLKLRGYGDAIVPEVAAEFIQAADR